VKDLHLDHTQYDLQAEMIDAEAGLDVLSVQPFVAKRIVPLRRFGARGFFTMLHPAVRHAFQI
jgi:hypothetical protein